MLPFDVTEFLHDSLKGDRRPPDGKLHPSGDLLGSLRHSQLRAAGAPTIESEIVSDVRLMTGTMWHSYFEGIFRQRRLPIMAEVKLDRWLPEGWSGTADWIVWNPQYRAFVLGDLKTIKGEGIAWVTKDGIKDEHMWQLSSYWYALEKMGIPLVKGFNVFYLPQNQVFGSSGAVPTNPIIAEGQPLDRDLVLGTMEDRWQATKRYLEDVGTDYRYETAEAYLSDHLAPVQDRVQKVLWNAKQEVFDLKLAPHWSATFCPYPLELCDCREQGVTKIGHYTLDACEHPGENYVARKGFEDIFPATLPNARDFTRRQAERNTVEAGA